MWEGTLTWEPPASQYVSHALHFVSIYINKIMFSIIKFELGIFQGKSFNKAYLAFDNPDLLSADARKNPGLLWMVSYCGIR